MRYKTGMYGGSFDPPHIGHMNCIIRAASVCEELFVVLSYSRNRDRIPMEYRYRWLYNSFRHMEHVHILLLEDSEKTKADYDTEELWQAGRDCVLAQIGKKVDVVFCGSDYEGTERYETLYGCPVIYYDRDDYSVSSSKIMEDPLRWWDYLPEIERPYFVRKVLLIGGESTGKSTLARNLAIAFNTNCLPEIGREVCDYAGGNEDLMIEEDFHEILLRHKVAELEAAKHSNRLLIVDTDALITKFFSRFLFSDPGVLERNDALADAIAAINRFDLILFLEPTVAFVQDGTRNEKFLEDREGYSEQIKRLFDEHGFSYHCIGGDYLNRFTEAKRLIRETFKL